MKTLKTNYAFIDNENVNVSVQKQKWKLDRGKFRERLRTEWNVEVAYMFMGYLEEYQPMYEFFTSLGYNLIFRPMNPNPDIPNKGNIDTDLVLHAMIDYPNYERAVIVSGDGDFSSLVRYLNQTDKLATVIVPNERRYSSFLGEAAGGNVVSLNQLKNALNYKPGAKKGVKAPAKTQGDKKLAPIVKKDTSNKPAVSKQAGPKQHFDRNKNNPNKKIIAPNTNQTKQPPKSDKQVQQTNKPTQPSQKPQSMPNSKPSNNRPQKSRRAPDDNFYA